MAGVADRGDSWQPWHRVEVEPGKPKRRVFGQRLKKTEWTKTAAENEAGRLELLAGGGLSKNCTFKEFALNCLANKGGAFDTTEKYERTINGFSYFLENKKYSETLSSVTKTVIDEFIKNCLKDHRPTGVNPYITYLRQIFDAANDKQLIRGNPMKDIRNFPAKKIPREIPTTEERDRMLVWFKKNEPLFFAWLYFMATRGWRRGELRAMKVKDVDVAGARVYIWTTKGDEPRTARLDAQDCMVLNEHMLYLKKRGLYALNGYLFPSRNGGLKNRDALNLKFKVACQELGITKKITCHTWRYFVVTSILDKTANIEVVKAITGHRDAQTIIDHYAQATPENVQRGLEITQVDLGLTPRKKKKSVSNRVSKKGRSQ